MVSGPELRRHPRFRVALAVEVGLPSGQQTTTTLGVSREGMSLRLDPVPAIDDVVTLTVTLPDGRLVAALGRCRGHMPDGVCGLHLQLDSAARTVWQEFIDQEESTGALWRMISRIAAAPDDTFAPRGETQRLLDGGGNASLRFHTVGENGLAYRLAFQRHASDPPETSDLCALLPGFREPARRVVRRVLREDVTLSFDEGGRPRRVRARVVELVRGGWAYAQGGDHGPIGFVALGAGELILVERDGLSVFPYFSALELEQIACDAFRNEQTRAVFPPTSGATSSSSSSSSSLSWGPSGSAEASNTVAGTSGATAAATTPPRRGDVKRFVQGYDAVRFAQAATEGAQLRRYGDRDLYFHPAVWAKVKLDDGTEFMGPTLQDGPRVCVLGLVGPGAPRVVRLTASSDVVLLQPPTG
jgi:hypothetical protein